jgi:signal peptidase II
MTKKRRITDIICLLLIGFFVFLDQYSKHLATVYLKPKTEDFTIIKNILALNYLQGGNEGAAWGIFSGKTVFLVLFTIIILCIILIFLHNTLVYSEINYSLKSKKFSLLQFLFCLLIAGAIGNIIDRILYGSVIDFICFRFINFPTFNVADIYVTVSCFLLIIVCVFGLKEDEFNRIFTLKIKGNQKND